MTQPSNFSAESVWSFRMENDLLDEVRKVHGRRIHKDGGIAVGLEVMLPKVLLIKPLYNGMHCDRSDFCFVSKALVLVRDVLEHVQRWQALRRVVNVAD